MEFQLPSTLVDHLAIYDPKQKATIEFEQKQEKQITRKQVNKNHLGLLTNLIPVDIVSQEDQTIAAQHINNVPAISRHWTFFKDIFIGARNQLRLEPRHIENQQVTAALFHHQSRWCALWLPKKEDKDKYIYGITLAFRDTDSTYEKLHYLKHNSINTYDVKPQSTGWKGSKILEHKDTIARVEVLGRTKFFVQTLYVTKEMIQKDLNYGDLWMLDGVTRYYSQKINYYKYAILHFEEALLKTIPQWKSTNKNNMFVRLKESPKQMLERVIGKYKLSSLTSHIPEDSEINLTTFLESFERSIKDEHLNQDKAQINQQVFNVINKPFFRSLLHQKLTKFNLIFNDFSIENERECSREFSFIIRLIEHIRQILFIWPDVSFDILRQNFELLYQHSCCLNRLSTPSDGYKESVLWLQNHMPVTSYFNILQRNSQKQPTELDHIATQELGINVYRCNHLADTFDMINIILDNNQKLDPPKRWRIDEFHDHVQQKAWTIQNKNINLPQDLFPSPIKLSIDNNTWTFIQPIDTHQLAQWGRAVRNCVGSSDIYAKKVKNKENLLILGMINNNPKFTVQCSIRDSRLIVDQIVSVMNRSLISEEKELYTKAFQMALETRHVQLLGAA